MRNESGEDREQAPIAEAIPDPASHFAHRPVAELIDYILRRHHAFTRRELPAVLSLLVDCEEHLDAGRETLSTVRALVEGLRDDMTEHMDKEEKALFPKLLALEKGEEVDAFRSVLDELEVEHDQGAETLNQMLLAASAAILPEDASGRFKEAHKRLTALDADMRVHIDIEQNVLLPRARRLMSRDR